MSGRPNPLQLKGLSAGRVARVLLLVSIAVLAVSILSNGIQWWIIERVASGGVTREEAAASDARQRFLGVSQVLMQVATGVVFLVWFYNAHRNLSKLGMGTTIYSSGWAVGGFFVPFLNIVRPAQVMSEVWHGSGPSPQLPGGAKPGIPVQVWWWWALFLVSSAVEGLAGRTVTGAGPSIDSLLTLTGMMILSDIAGIVSASFAILIVGRVLLWQTARIPQVLARSQGAEPPSMGPVDGPPEVYRDDEPR